MKRDFDRRRVLAALGASAAGMLIAPRYVAAAGDAGCVVRPQQTEGPYFVDEKLNRSDIRIDPADGSSRPGVPLRVTFHVSKLTGSACAPLAGAVVDIWHCDALGIYSDVRDDSFDTRGKKFLRGYQVTDANGDATFVTIYPGWYSGRAVHLHFMVRTDPAANRARVFTSQLYFDDALTDAVHTQAPYASKGSRRIKNVSDGIFRSGAGNELLLSATADGHGGYAGIFGLALKLA